jgi:ABC-type multidrug transport system fused ATPase/permease subunit
VQDVHGVLAVLAGGVDVTADIEAVLSDIVDGQAAGDFLLCLQGAYSALSSLPDGLDTVAGDRGYRFSGGEKQRIALARLLLKAPPVVVLDEATAHLDSESELAIQQALKTALAGRISLVIAHRLSTIQGRTRSW